MAEGKEYFYRPWVGGGYAEGCKGLRTLVVGAHHVCYANRVGGCPVCEGCTNSAGIRGVECPLYEGRDPYYRLENSNEIEIQSYIDNDAGYPAYSAFTHYMLGKRDGLSAEQREGFWNQVAFTNYLQHFLPDDITPDYKGHKALYDYDYESFREVLDELKPEFVIVWSKAVKECIQAHGDLRYVGLADMQSLSVHLFVRKGEARPKCMRKIRYDYSLATPRHNSGWYRKLVREAFQPWVRIDEKMRLLLNHLADALMELTKEGVAFAFEELMCFEEDVTTSHKAMLRDLLGRHIPIPQGIAPALAHIFNDRNIGKYTIAKQSPKSDPITAKIKAVIESNL
ncbi:MAG: hypothetical protein LIP02_13400 [Bacteroidales bacterium]|nr:hypothetical protein [Bacteroidales bacterium]